MTALDRWGKVNQRETVWNEFITKLSALCILKTYYREVIFS